MFERHKMKKILVLLTVLCLMFTVGCIKTNIKIGESQKFSQDEIESAMDCVKETFNLNFDDCTLTDLWYEEEASNKVMRMYKNSGRGSINGVDESNVIVLHSNFKVGSNQDTVFTPNSVYFNWSWTLIRDGESGEWVADEWGYA